MQRQLRSLAILGALCVVASSGGGCASERPASDPTPTPRAAKPPVEAIALEPDYREALADIGLVLTPRGGLIDRSDGGYRKSATGSHLALYLEPAATRSVDQYVDGIAAAARVFLPSVFERWPGLESFDVCQEPGASAEEPKDPPAVTQIDVTRAQAAAVDWRTVGVRELVQAAEDDPPRLKLLVSDALRASDAYVNATRATS
jgi:hypothetical protein